MHLPRGQPHADPHAVVIGAGLGGLAAAMRLGAKGYRVTVMDRLDMPGGRGSSITRDGHRFDLGPTIVTVPQVFEELWAACGRDFDKDVDLRALDPFYEIRWPDGVTLHRAAGYRGDAGRGGAAVARRSAGLRAVPEGQRESATGSGSRIWAAADAPASRPV